MLCLGWLLVLHLMVLGCFNRYTFKPADAYKSLYQKLEKASYAVQNDSVLHALKRSSFKDFVRRARLVPEMQKLALSVQSQPDKANALLSALSNHARFLLNKSQESSKIGNSRGSARWYRSAMRVEEKKSLLLFVMKKKLQDPK